MAPNVNGRSTDGAATVNRVVALDLASAALAS
jgi:hypothetical protein